MDTSALLLLDLQNEMVSPDGKVGAAGMAKAVADRGVLDNAATLLAAARKAGIPVFHVRLGFRPDYADCLSVAPRIDRLKANGAVQIGTWATEFPDVIAPGDGEVIVTKQCVNAFFNTNLMALLWSRGITRLFMGGVATNLVVESTARAADDAGFAVNVVEDICAAGDPAVHDWLVRNSLPLFGRVVSTADAAAEFAAA